MLIGGDSVANLEFSQYYYLDSKLVCGDCGGCVLFTTKSTTSNRLRRWRLLEIYYAFVGCYKQLGSFSRLKKTTFSQHQLKDVKGNYE